MKVDAICECIRMCEEADIALSAIAELGAINGEITIKDSTLQAISTRCSALDHPIAREVIKAAERAIKYRAKVV